MSVATLVSRINYPGAGSTGPFVFPFKIQAASHLVVVRRDSSYGETTLTKDVDYTLTGVGQTSGTVTLTDALDVGETLALIRSPALTQPMSIRNQGSYYPATLEDECDLLAMQLQALSEEIDRSIGIAASYDGADLDLRGLRPETGKVVGWLDSVTLGNMTLDTNATALPGVGRTVASLTAYLLNNSVFNVLDYGALGNGVTDDHDAIQLAITSATTGSVVWIPRTASYYKIDTSGGRSDAILVNKKLTIVIDGELRATTHDMDADPTCLLNVTGDDVTIIGAGTFKGDGTVDDTNAGTDATMPCLVRVTGARFTMDGPLFDTVPKIGLHLDGAYHAHITNCRFTGGVVNYSGTAYFGIRGNQGGRHVIDGNRFYPDAGGGMLVSCIFSNNCNECVINGNVAYRPFEKLFYWSGSYSVFSNNVVIGNSGVIPGTVQAGTVGPCYRVDGVYNKVNNNFSRYGGGAQSLGGQGCTFSNNTFLECGQSGITVTAGAVPLHNLLISDNLMTCGNLAGTVVNNGIYVEPANAVGQSKNIRITDNTVIGFSPAATAYAQIRVTGTAADEITRAVIANNSLAEGARGISLDYVINSHIHDNRIYATEWGILEANGGTNRYESNPVEGAANDGISGLAATSIADIVVNWTPIISDGAVNATAGGAGVNGASYIRRGNDVFVTGQCLTTALGAVPGGNPVRITGLPIAAAAGIKNRAAVSIGNAGGHAIAAGQSIIGEIQGGNNYIELYLWDAVTGATPLLANEWAAGGWVIFSCRYTCA